MPPHAHDSFEEITTLTVRLVNFKHNCQPLKGLKDTNLNNTCTHQNKTSAKHELKKQCADTKYIHMLPE